MSDRAGDVLLWVGVLLVVAGVGMLHMAAGVIVAGLLCLGLAYLGAAAGVKR